MSDHTLPMLAEIRDLLVFVCERVGVSPPPRVANDYADVEPLRLYTVRELVELRGGSRQSLYKAMTCGRLKETVSSGRRMVRGRDFIAFLRKRRQAQGRSAPRAAS